MRLVQYKDTAGAQHVAVVEDENTLIPLKGVSTTRELATIALAKNMTMIEKAKIRMGDDRVDYNEVVRDGRLLPPITHVDPAHFLVTGTGLTHLGSASARANMHKADNKAADETDSMKMFRMGVEGGKPKAGEHGVQPEWFYKGDGSIVANPGAAIPSPSFALDGSEEPEIAAVYIIDHDGTPVRIGFAIGNEFSDHVMERQNYLYLAHSKLRHCAMGPELLLGDLPSHVEGTSRLYRDGKVIWEKQFVSGEDNMSHSLANLEYHHFKYDLFRRPGDVHAHFFGTATLSFADGITTQDGDEFEISSALFGRPIRNRLMVQAERPVVVKAI
ncbi:AraD1 family protein [Thalassospira sp. MCCC 1A02491]|uniref:AraD1 family protein n=1 Tax=Thalassospira sp. MCCC 1A02491 TaxID=1769751 RepID=UPI0007AD708E|nr:AraD1 family protein [Thalassospira sp. MCCC 1A02491]KZB68833.1 FAH family protein [Thalassospira sp. MCCC 1A02491]